MNAPEMRSRILVADDNEEILNFLRESLESFGAEVESVCNGERALEVAFVRPFDLVVLDIDMPQMDGLETCRRLRALPFTAELPVLFLTADTRASTIEEAFRVGATDFLCKPVNALVLRARISNLIGIRKMSQEVSRISEALKNLGTTRS